MELWIRSQDKTKLVCVNSIRIEDTIYTNNNEFFIIGSGYDLGIYSKKRALEVLDEIQNILETREDVKQMVYQMPKE